METGRLISVLGLGFGDCGKGLFTDFLAHRLRAHTVVRFNGGAQAGHNVVLADGRHHTFSQLGSGAFLPGVATVLTHPIVVHPTALSLEADHLERMGVQDCLARLKIDPRCLVTTPFHQALGRIRELARGHAPHGTCGVGVGETVRQGLAHPCTAVRFGDLWNRSLTLEKLEVLQNRIQLEVQGFKVPFEAEAERNLVFDRVIPARWYEKVSQVLARLSPCTEDPLSATLQRPGTVVFEGAQGLLLDEWIGFHPFTTWSSPRPDALEALVREAGSSETVHPFGVMRSYLTRHGPGPLPTEDPTLDSLEELHNANDGWQGRFRRGHPDGVLLDYARKTLGIPLSGVFISHMDVFQRPVRLRWCASYEAPDPGPEARMAGRKEEGRHIISLSPGPRRDLTYQEHLTALLTLAKPQYARDALLAPEALIERVEGALGCRVRLTSSGAIRDLVQEPKL